MAKDATKKLEERIHQPKAESVPYLEVVKIILTEKPSSGLKKEGKGEKPVPSESEPSPMLKEDPVKKLLKNSASHRQLKISGLVGEPKRKDKTSFSSLARQIQTGLTQGYEGS